MQQNFLNNLILNCQNQHKHLHFKNVDIVRPSWNEILYVFNRVIEEELEFRIFDNFGFTLLKLDEILIVKQMLEEISKATGKHTSAHCYISMSSKSKTFGRHKDQADVLFWQIQGKTKWIVEDTELVQYVLDEGDMIYVPKEMMHEVFPLGPRAGISFGVH